MHGTAVTLEIEQDSSGSLQGSSSWRGWRRYPRDRSGRKRRELLRRATKFYCSNEKPSRQIQRS